MKTKIALCLLAAALLPACTTMRTANRSDAKSGQYADNTAAEPAPPAEGPTEDIPAEGPHDVATNPAYVPTPLLRRSAASQP